MKKFLFSVIAASLFITGFAQTPSYKKRPSLGINFFLKDFVTPDRLGAGKSLADVLKNNQWNKIKNMSPGLQVQYFSGLTEYVDFTGLVGGSFVNYPFLAKSGIKPTGQDNFLLELDAAVNVKLLTDKYFVVPYFTAGIGASMYKATYFAAYIPTGLGLQFNLGSESFLNLQFRNNLAVTNLANYNFNYSLGFSSPLTDKKEVAVVAAPPPPPAPIDTDADGITDDKDKCPTVKGSAKYDGCPIPDTDGDGINDEEDKCKTVKGTAKYQGCPIPDTDGDGINDENDKCKDVRGLAKYQGCPIPDTDKDGINDEEDKCVTVAGLARYQGCPIPDTDGDGVNDEEDKCKTVKGTVANNGCPEIQNEFKFDYKKVQFLTGSVSLTAGAKKELNKVVAALNAYPTLNLFVDGHTDNAGKAAANQTLSLKRANAVKAYLVAKKVDAARLTTEGFGSDKPVADNKTAKGRSENRRVEFRVQE